MSEIGGERRVAVTGVGLVTPLGVGASANWDALLDGKCGIRPIDLFDTTSLPIGYGGYLPNFKARKYIKKRKNLKVMTRSVQLGKVAAVLAMEQAGLKVGVPNINRAGMFVGAGQAFGDSNMLELAISRSRGDGDELDIVKFGRDGLKFVHPLWLLKGLSNNVLGLVTARYNLRGINNNYCHSGVSGGQAIGEAYLSIADGRADIVLAGGHDSLISEGSLLGYGRLGMFADPDLDPKIASRPFDKERTGIVPGEGGGFVVLEEWEHALARGIDPIAEVQGYAMTNSVEGVTEPEESGASLTYAIKSVLKKAGWASSQIDFIESHANGSMTFDPIELNVFDRVFEKSTDGPFLTAIKSYTGHSLAASGAIGASITCVALKNRIIPKVLNLKEPAIDGNYRFSKGGDSLPNGAPGRALSVCMGLGGQTCVLAFKGVD